MVHMTELAGTSAMQKCLCWYYNPCEIVTNLLKEYNNDGDYSEKFQ